MKKIEIDEQKKIQLNMLKYIKSICEENSITYFLGGGTLLGAIRHKGYIPWDDDIDIMLPRKDYNKLKNVFNDLKNEEYKLLSYENCDSYYYPFAKIVNTKTKLIEYNQEEIEELGIYIDIFPIDEIPDEEKERKKVFKKFVFYNRLLKCYKHKDFSYLSKSKISIFVKQILKSIINIFKLKNNILNNIDKICTKYTNTNTVACITGVYFEKEIMPKSYISDYVMVEFEGEEFKAPIGYDEYLTKHYGDYMKLPPKEKQVSNHNTKVFWR